MGNRLSGKVAIVTGAGRGIGRSVALRMASEGATIVVNDLGGNIDGTDASPSPADNVVDEIISSGGRAIASHQSVAEFKSASEIVESAIENFGHVDILCSTAGILRDRMIFNMTEEEWDDVLGVHLYGAFNMISNCVPYMIREGYGRIVLFASSSGLGSAGQANYSAAKEGIVGFARSLSKQFEPNGISINAVYPIAKTRMMASVPDRVRQRSAKQPPGAGGVGASELFDSPEPEEAMNPDNNAIKVVYLCTEEGGSITGEVITTGGWSVSRMPKREVTKSIRKNTPWTVNELQNLLPISLAAGLVNPSPMIPS